MHEARLITGCWRGLKKARALATLPLGAADLAPTGTTCHTSETSDRHRRRRASGPIDHSHRVANVTSSSNPSGRPRAAWRLSQG
jgi:hypothetical protein